MSQDQEQLLFDLSQMNLNDEPKSIHLPGFPLHMQTHVKEIQSHKTQFLFCEYANLFLLMISQTGKPGTLVRFMFAWY